jgi:Rrf2 family protein
MLSQKARYALRALFVLVEREKGASVQIAEIAEEADVPRKFLEQILLEMKKRGIVHSIRGKHGGYTLGRAPEEIMLAEVIRTIDGPLALSPCASRTAYRKCDDCIDENTCSMRKVLLDVRDATASILESRSLSSMVETQKAKPGKAAKARKRAA